MTGRPRAWLLAALLLATAGWISSGRDERRFPHTAHARLFPTCLSCHAGIPVGDAATAFPRPQVCAQCHDGREAKPVSWDGPRVAPSNLRFSHPLHAQRADSVAGAGGRAPRGPLDCGACHGLPETPAAGMPADTGGAWMTVARARPERCIQCHAHAASGHLAMDSRCVTCHVPLVRAVALGDSAVRAFPRPPSHEAPDFLNAHGRIAAGEEGRCAVCHSRESCARCHANGASVPAIAALGSDARVASMVRDRPARYPVPPGHERPSFRYEHGADARSAIAGCANCHTQPSCRACHIGSGASRAIGALPRPVPGGAPGVRLRARGSDPTGAQATARHAAPRLASGDSSSRERLTSVHPAGFLRAHGPAASAGQLTCTGCHVRRFCADCHDGEGRRRYHAANFVARHAADSYGRESDCASCHNPEAFCRSCHVGLGLGANGRLDAGFHNAQPLWLLQHGQAARQGLQSCTTCHTQRDCMQCHSTATQSIDPHGPGFDAERMAKRSREACSLCHLGDPLGRR